MLQVRETVLQTRIGQPNTPVNLQSTILQRADLGAQAFCLHDSHYE